MDFVRVDLGEEGGGACGVGYALKFETQESVD